MAIEIDHVVIVLLGYVDLLGWRRVQRRWQYPPKGGRDDSSASSRVASWDTSDGGSVSSTLSGDAARGVGR